MKWTTEAKVGAFTLIGIALFAYAILFLGDITLFKAEGMKITGEFQSVTGLKSGYPVRYSGVDVGKVKDIIASPGGVTVVMDLDKNTKIPEDSNFSIEGDGLLGEKFIQISPGKANTYLAAGAKVKGDGSGGMDKAVHSAEEMMEEATRMMKSINNVIGDEKTQESLRGALRSTDSIAKNVEAMTIQMNSLMAENTGKINELASNMVLISRNMNHLTHQLNESMTRVDGDGKTSENMRQIAENMKEVTSRMNRMAAAMEGVVTDPQSAEDIKETLHNTAHLTSVLSTLTGGGNSSAMTVDPRLEMLYNTTSNDYSANANIRFFTKNAMGELGLSHIGDGSKLNANIGKQKGDFTFRGGIFDGDVGVGIDYGLQQPFTISVAAMNPNDARYRIRTELKLLKDTYVVGQFIRPYSAEYGGNYFGINHKF